VKVTKRGRLPHWHAEHATYFVTFNLFDAVPREFVERLRIERQVRIAELERLRQRATRAELHAIDRVLRERVEECLDVGVGECFMRNPAVADVVTTALTHFDRDRYELLAWSVMPNHVHVVFEPHQQVDRIIHSWKSYTAKAANRILRRDGHFWQEDYWDRLIRNPRELERTIRYVVENPLRAGLIHWKWPGERASRPQEPAVPAGS
jgi:REP element-mobilizing transposase RayT